MRKMQKKMNVQQKLFEELKHTIEEHEGYPLFAVFLTEKGGGGGLGSKKTIYCEFRYIESTALMKNPTYKLKAIELLENYIAESKRQLSR